MVAMRIVTRSTIARLAGTAMLCSLVSCGDKSPTVPSPGSEPQVETNTITITSTGASPRNVSVTAGSRVLFINNDGRSHNMTSDPHPDHSDCLPLNQVGFLSAGQRRETGNLVDVRTCGFHDHDDPGRQTLWGQIVIRAATAPSSPAPAGR
jgi:plastocyanin